MSGKVGGQVWELDLARPKKWVLLKMADNAHDDGSKCYPGVGYLAHMTGYSERQVKRILRDLESDELIEAVAHAEGGRGHATEYTIHTEKGVKLAPYRRKTKGDTVSPFSSLKGDTDDTKGDISDTKGDTWMSPQPSGKPSSEPSSSPGGVKEPQKKSRKDRSRPEKVDYHAKVVSFLAANPTLGEEVQEFIARVADRNESGEMTYGRQWRGFCLPIEIALKDGATETAILYALQESNRVGARDMRYFETVLENNPNGRPRRRNGSNNGNWTHTNREPASISGDEGAARRQEGYEWLFATGEPSTAAEVEPKAPESDEQQEAEVEYLRRLKFIERNMKHWRATMDDKEYLRQVSVLKPMAKENGVTLADIERLDEQIRAGHAEKVSGL